MKKLYKSIILCTTLSLSLISSSVLAAGPSLNTKPLENNEAKLKLDPIDQKIIFELYKTTLKPLILERIENDVKLLAEQKKCVILAQNPEAFRLCDKKFLAARREKAEEITQIVEKKRVELNKKYGLDKSSSKTSDLFK